LKILFLAKQCVKMLIQNCYLPLVYKKECKAAVEKGKIIFADAHSAYINNSMQVMYDSLVEKSYHVHNMCVNFKDMSMRQQMKYMRDFMKEYASAEYVFISSYFLPVSSCKKRPETTVVQLWHAGGLMKKMGYDAKDDIPKFYIGKPTANYDLVTVSAPPCIPVWAQAWNIPIETVKATGIARTDRYYDQAWNQENIRKFREIYPQAEGKKVCVYAPTFAGNAGNPYSKGLTSGILDVIKKLENEWFFIIKLHPHMEKEYPQYACSMKTEELFASADLLISDYSTIIYDFLVYRKPFLLYAPDLDEYEAERGFYIEYKSLPACVDRTPDELLRDLSDGSWEKYRDKLDECFDYYMKNCDGQAAKRIMQECGLTKE